MKTKKWENMIDFTHKEIQQLPLSSVIPIELPVTSPGKSLHFNGGELPLHRTTCKLMKIIPNYIIRGAQE